MGRLLLSPCIIACVLEQTDGGTGNPPRRWRSGDRKARWLLKYLVAISLLAVSLSACTTSTGYDAPALEPIPGSITYGGQPRTRLTKAPIGSPVNHQFRNELGQRVEERYIIQPDRSLKLVWRRVYREWMFGDD